MQAISQTSVYHPFPDSNAVWNEQTSVLAGDCPGPPYPNPYLIDSYFSYRLQGDTIINLITYHNIIQSGTFNAHCNIGGDNWGVINNVWAGAYRQEIAQKKVFFIGPNTSGAECLLYDFNLNVGDTLHPGTCDNQFGCSSPVIVISIDSVLVGNNYRKRYNLEMNGMYPNDTLIEGIGATSGLLETICAFESGGNLICFSQNNQPQYPDTSVTCELITKLPEIKNEPTFSVFPNPVNDNFTIEQNGSLQATNFEIMNSLGQLIYFGKLNDITTVSTTNFSKGAYFIRFISSKGVFYKKIIIQ